MFIFCPGRCLKDSRFWRILRTKPFNFECLGLRNVERPFESLEIKGEDLKLPFDLIQRKGIQLKVLDC